MISTAGMRLLSTSQWKFGEFYRGPGDGMPRYAILSHRWEQDEFTYQEALLQSINPLSLQKLSKGLEKIFEFRRLAAAEDFEWVWIDTCCIDKSSSAELTEAINSMFTWYRQSRMCFAYLSDVHAIEQIPTSKWFDRGWTLQELLGPSEIRFYGTQECTFDCKLAWTYLGRKSTPQILAALQRRTNIPRQCLLSATRIPEQPVAVKMSWASGRHTTREEDKAYCLLGIFDVNMPLLYGEGVEKAFRRVQEEIIKYTDDQTIFGHDYYHGILAHSPSDFWRGSELRTGLPARYDLVDAGSRAYAITNKGLEIELPYIEPSHVCEDTFGKIIARVAILNCHESETKCALLLPLEMQANHPTRPTLSRAVLSESDYTRFQGLLNDAIRERRSIFRYQTMYIKWASNRESGRLIS